MTIDNFCFYLQNRLIQTSETGGQWYNNTSLFSIPWSNALAYSAEGSLTKKNFLDFDTNVIKLFTAVIYEYL